MCHYIQVFSQTAVAPNSCVTRGCHSPLRRTQKQQSNESRVSVCRMCAALAGCGVARQRCDANAVCVRGGAGAGGASRAESACACVEGYAGDGLRCDDVDECAAGRSGAQGPCPPGALCLNARGSFHCRCPPGLQLNNDSSACVGTHKNTQFI